MHIPAADLTLISRHTEALAKYSALGVNIFHGQHGDKSSLEAGYAGADRLFMISSLSIGKRGAEHANAISAAKAAGIQHITYTSVAGAHPENPTPSANDHVVTERLLWESGISFASLRNQMYAELLYNMVNDMAIPTGKWVHNSAIGKFSPVSRKDIAASVTAIMLSPGKHDRVVYEITGPERITFPALAQLAADYMYSTILNEELGRTGSMGFNTVIGGHAYLAMNYLIHAGSLFIKEKYLVPSVAGEKIGSLSLTEPFAGSDLQAIRTTATLEGDHYIINGSKTFISNGFYGDYTVAACRTENGISMIVMDLDAPGITKSKLDKIGIRCSDTAELAFNEVKVPKENLLGEEGKGFYYMMQSLQVERLSCAQSNIGLMEYVLDITLQYISERSAFGKPINKLQVLRHRIADIASDVAAWKSFMYQTSYRLSLGESVVKECSMLKMKTADLLNDMVYQCQQMFGGYGFMEEYPIGRVYRDVRITSIYGGTSEIMAEIISKIVIDKKRYQPAY